MFSPLLSLIDSLPCDRIHSDSLIKTVPARAAILALPRPSGRNAHSDLIPDVNIELILSTGPALPALVRDFIAMRGDSFLANDNDLLGLAMNGRVLPPRLFLHRHRMQDVEPTGRLLENIFWHEALHALEGIDVLPHGVRRATPWSYHLQADMLALDNDFGGGQDIDAMYQSEAARDHVRYLRGGTPAQDNVSEVFARVGVCLFKHIRAGKPLPQTMAETYAFLSPDMLIDAVQNPPPSGTIDTFDAFDLGIALMTFGDKARQGFWWVLPEMISRIAALYGCDLPVPTDRPPAPRLL